MNIQHQDDRYGVEMLLLEVIQGLILRPQQEHMVTNKTIESTQSKVACLTRLSVYGTEINNDGMRLSKYAKLSGGPPPTEETNRLRAACPN